MKINIHSVLEMLQHINVDPNDVGGFLTKAKLDVAKFNAGTPQERNKIVKTALRTYLPFPLSLAAGEVLVQLKKQVKPIRDAIEKGVKL